MADADDTRTASPPCHLVEHPGRQLFVAQRAIIRVPRTTHKHKHFILINMIMIIMIIIITIINIMVIIELVITIILIM